jgi:hypothetical protein
VNVHFRVGIPIKNDGNGVRLPEASGSAVRQSRSDVRDKNMLIGVMAVSAAACATGPPRHRPLGHL